MMHGELSQNGPDRLRTVLAGHVARGAVPGLVALVARWDDLQVETIGRMTINGDAPMQRDTIFRIASMTKPVTAAAAMMLVEECRLRLDDPLDRWLPELADRRVLRAPNAALDDTVPAQRPITLRDLLTFRLGIGAIMAPPGLYPIAGAMAEAGLAPGPHVSRLTPDEWIKRLGGLPLVHQPGEVWMYHTGSDVLTVLVERATGQRLDDFLEERLFAPLGMVDTGFHVPADKRQRFATSYLTDPATGTLTLYDDPRSSQWAEPPAFCSGGAGLVSTANDYLAFCRMLLGKGRYGGAQILSRRSVEVMTTDQLTPAQKAASPFAPGFWDSRGWGFGLSVVTRSDDLAAVPGRFGWDGGLGTSAYTDPQEGLIGILLTQGAWTSPVPPAVTCDFWTLAYQTTDD
jgi:CubicO group peptidase (beta-lactamase class C family)